MDRDQAVDVVTKIAANFPRLTGEASQTDAGWEVRVRVPAAFTMRALTVDEARTAWRFLVRDGERP